MLSRASQLTRLNAFIIFRQLSTSQRLSKQAQITQKDPAGVDELSNSQSTNKTEPESLRSVDQRPSLKNLKGEISRIKNLNNSKISNNRNNRDIKVSGDIKFDLNSKSQEKSNIYKSIINNIDLESPQKLIESCQKLNNLYDSNSKTAQQFHSDPLKPRVVKALTQNLHKMNLDEFVIAVHFIFRFDPNKFENINPLISKNAENFNITQLLKLVASLRLLAFNKPIAMNTLRETTDRLRSRIDEIGCISDTRRALKLFSSEPSVVQRIDIRVSQLAEKLTLDDWIELLNTKSVLRQRNVRLLELCAYNINKQLESKQDSHLSLDQIHKCLLSCGILSYHDGSFYQLIINQLQQSLEKSGSTKWMVENEPHLQAIITSLGMLQLRHEKTLETLCTLLKNNRDRIKLIVSFVQTCGALNYAPNEAQFAPIIAALGDPVITHFNLNDSRDRSSYLNYVWSLCALDRADQYLVASVLEKKFFDSILKDKTSKDFKSNLLKVLNINMHSMFRMDNYEGPNISEDFNLAEFSEILAPKKSLNSNNMLEASLAGFRSINKYVKLNLLTSFGILIDAFMIIDKSGIPQPLEKYLEKGSFSEDNEDDIRVAFKFISFKDQTLIDKQINGIVQFQLSLLREVGYYPLIIYQEELQSAASLKNRVNLIQNKLIDLAQQKN